MQVHRMNFPTSWEQYWEKAPLLWCDPRENPSCCHSSKRYWFNNCTAGLQGSVKLMLADLLPKILMLHVRLPRVSKACRSMTEKCCAHWQPSAGPLLPGTVHLSCFSAHLVLQPTDSCQMCSDIFRSGSKELATNWSVSWEHLFKNRKHILSTDCHASTLAFTDLKQKQLYRGEGCYTF